jgi:2-methylaconitate cis-trans-isomerase PrpF
VLPQADVDYLFLQVAVDKAEVSDSQNCGNILAGAGPWAIEQGLVSVAGEATPVRIHMVNTGSIAVAHVPTPQLPIASSPPPAASVSSRARSTVGSRTTPSGWP